MKNKIIKEIDIPEGINCEYSNYFLKCEKDSVFIKRKITIPEVEIQVKNNKLKFECKKGNKSTYKTIMSFAAHIENMLSGLQKNFIYKLEACNVHFPMVLKLEGDKISIGNFLGEKTSRYAKILPNVEVKINGQQIIISSSDKEAAGQTAANLEKSTKIKGRDRRIYQDGIFITQKPGREL
ncbi:MAG: 50S ribosomal protein L6 [Nanoarchaeota archaeon]